MVEVDPVKTTLDKLKPTPGKIGLAGGMLALAFLVTATYPALASMDWKGALLFWGCLVGLGAVVAVAGLCEMNLLYTLPVLLLAFRSPIVAVGLFLFCAMGMAATSSRFSNQIEPRMGGSARFVFGLPHTVLALTVVVSLFSSLSFTIPRNLEELAVEQLGSLVMGSMIDCSLDMTGGECLTKLANDMIEDQCGGDQACLETARALGLESQIVVVEDQVETVLPNFNRGATIKDQVVDWLDQQMNVLLEPLTPVLSWAMAAGIFFTLQMMARWVATPLASILVRLLLGVLGAVGLVEKTTVQAEKTVFEV